MHKFKLRLETSNHTHITVRSTLPPKKSWKKGRSKPAASIVVLSFLASLHPDFRLTWELQRNSFPTVRYHTHHVCSLWRNIPWLTVRRILDGIVLEDRSWITCCRCYSIPQPQVYYLLFLIKLYSSVISKPCAYLTAFCSFHGWASRQCTSSCLGIEWRANVQYP
jgi:hypothetical protein